MKRPGGLVQIERGYEKAVSRSKLAIEKNTSLLDVTVPMGVIQSLARVRRLPAARAARGSAASLEPALAPPVQRRIELALMAAIFVALAVSLVVATM